MKDILLQRSLAWALGRARPNALNTNLVLHHRVADVFDHAAEFIQILCTGEETCDLSLLCQRNQVFENAIQFAVKRCTSDRLPISGGEELPSQNLPSLLLLDLTRGNRPIQRSCQPFNPRYQRFDRLTTCDRFLGTIVRIPDTGRRPQRNAPRSCPG